MKARTAEESAWNVYEIMQKAVEQARTIAGPEGEYKIIGKTDLRNIITAVSESTTYACTRSYLNNITACGFVRLRDKFSYHVMEQAWYASRQYAEHQQAVITIDAVQGETPEQ